ncbi:MAG: hypothetical protein ACR2N7_02500 [Acidimicrobiia bacterium]
MPDEILIGQIASGEAEALGFEPVLPFACVICTDESNRTVTLIAEDFMHWAEIGKSGGIEDIQPRPDDFVWRIDSEPSEWSKRISYLVRCAGSLMTQQDPFAADAMGFPGALSAALDWATESEPWVVDTEDEVDLLFIEEVRAIR